MISEVNADIKYYLERSDGTFVVVSSDKSQVGKHISTKAVGRREREDITKHYKYAEGSAAERAALIGDKSDEEEAAVRFEAKMISGNRIGDDLSFEVTGEIISAVSGMFHIV